MHDHEREQAQEIRRLQKLRSTYNPLAICVVFAAAGILIDWRFEISLRIWTNCVLIFLAAWIFCFIKRPNDGYGFHRSQLFILTAVLCAFGGWHHYWWFHYSPDDIGFFASVEPHPVSVRGTIIESAVRVPAPPPDPGQPIATPSRIQFTIRVSEIRDAQNWIPASGKAVVRVDGDDTFLPHYGDQLKIFGTLFAPAAAKNPGGFDSKIRYKQRRIRAVIQVASGDAFQVEQENPRSLIRLQESIRRNAQRNLHKYMHGAASPLATAMILGLREDVPDETTQRLRETGTMHILAISGLHVGLIAGAFTLLLQIFGVPNRGVALCVMIIVLFYFSLTDLRPPALRATALICVACLAVLVRQNPVSINTLSFTAIIVLIRNPTELFQFGTQLSFLVTSIFIWFPSFNQCGSYFPFSIWYRIGEKENILRKKLHLQNVEEVSQRKLFFVSFEMFLFQIGKQGVRLLLNVFHLILLSIAIFWVSLPIILSNIHLMTPVAMLVNPILWIPLTFALVCGFATMVFAWIFSPLAILFGNLGTFFFESLEQMLRFFHALPNGAFWYPGPPQWWMLGFYLPLAFLTLFPRFSLRFRWILSLFLLWSVLGFCSGYVRNWERLWAERLTITVLSVGHGTCTLIQTPQGKTIIYDAGCFSRPMIGANVLSQCLWDAGKTHIDAIVISHPDTDHFNAVPELAKRFSVGGIYVSPFMFEKTEPAVLYLRNEIQKRKIPLHVVGAGDSLDLKTSTKFTFLHPSAKRDTAKIEMEPNATSLVMLIGHRDVHYLFPGDLDSKRGTIAVDFLKSEPIHCDTIMVPHHGGSSSFTEPLIQWCQPNSLLISGGKFTYYRESVDRLRERGMNVYHTFEDGFIRLNCEKNGQKIETPLKKREEIESR